MRLLIRAVIKPDGVQRGLVGEIIARCVEARLEMTRSAAANAGSSGCLVFLTSLG